jgi:glycosyltransferase involved in cell wall biosynthesis
VVTVHDIVPYLVRDDPQQSTFSHPFDRFFDSLAMHSLRKADLLICVSACTARALVEYFSCSPDKIRVVHNGIDHDLFHPVPVNGNFLSRFGLPQDALFILYVGSDIPRKNLPRLLHALARLKAHFPGIKLLKVGTPEYLLGSQELRKLVQDLDLEDMVVSAGHVSQADLTGLYSAASLFVFPSLYEGFGLPVLEAMACGTPVVTSNTSSLPEVAGDAALLVDPYDVDAIASALRRVLEDPALAHDLRERGLTRARQFTWERTARETLAVYQQLLDA